MVRVGESVFEEVAERGEAGLVSKGTRTERGPYAMVVGGVAGQEGGGFVGLGGG